MITHKITSDDEQTEEKISFEDVRESVYVLRVSLVNVDSLKTGVVTFAIAQCMQANRLKSMPPLLKAKGNKKETR